MCIPISAHHSRVSAIIIVESRTSVMAGIEFISPEGLRVDGRRPPELRKLECQLGVCQEADGSASLTQGNTKVLATVYGPHDVSRRSEAVHDRAYLNFQYSMATFSTSERRKRPRGDRKSNEVSIALKRTFEAAIMTELYPFSKIDVFVQVLQSDGSNKAVAINAATMALIDAGVPMKDFVCASSSGYVQDTAIVDLNYLEETARGPKLTIATLPKSGKIILCQMDSCLHKDHLEDVMKAGVMGSSRVHTVLNSTVQTHLQSSFPLCNP